MNAGLLAIVEIDGERYYDDVCLREYRHVDDFSNRILYSEVLSEDVKVIQPRIEYNTPEWDAHVKKVEQEGKSKRQRTENIEKKPRARKPGRKPHK